MPSSRIPWAKSFIPRSCKPTRQQNSAAPGKIGTLDHLPTDPHHTHSSHTPTSHRADSPITRRTVIIVRQRMTHIHTRRQHRRQINTRPHERTQEHLHSPRRQPVSNTHDKRRNGLRITNPAAGVPVNSLIVILRPVTIAQRRQSLFHSGRNTYLPTLPKSLNTLIKVIILLHLAHDNPLIMGHGIHQLNKSLDLTATRTILLPRLTHTLTGYHSSPRSLIAWRVIIITVRQRVAYVHALRQHRGQINTSPHERTQNHLHSPRRQPVSNPHDRRRHRLRATNPTTRIEINNLLVIPWAITITQRRQSLFHSSRNTHFSTLKKSLVVLTKIIIFARLTNSHPLVVGHGVHQPDKRLDLTATRAVLLPRFTHTLTSHPIPPSSRQTSEIRRLPVHTKLGIHPNITTEISWNP